MQEYSLADLKRLFGLPPALIRKLAAVETLVTVASSGAARR